MSERRWQVIKALMDYNKLDNHHVEESEDEPAKD